tara:strand:+ start:4692 stop:5774 length:1083 start_codon:yes stop_codon:yes gene_type:complete
MALAPNPIGQFLPGMQLYKYQLRQKVGAGGFGEVWLAQDQALNHEYAIKILKPGMPVHQRLREAQIGHVLNHNNLVRVHQADVVQIGPNELVVIAMDFLPDGAITKLANPSRYLPLPDVVRLGTDLLRGLEYLHGQDIFHNDIKPENVLIGPQGQGMLTDYGIVGVTINGAPVPAPNFYKIHAAPEILQANQISAQTDVYQAGLTLFRMLVGLDTLRQKFQVLGQQAYYAAVAQSNLIEASDFPAYVPSRLRRIILKATAANLNDRYKNPLEMRRDLERLNYPGYWSVKPNGTFVGYNGKCTYRYEQAKGRGNKYDISAYRRNEISGRETRICAHCHSSVTNNVAKAKITNFVKAVVEGL